MSPAPPIPIDALCIGHAAFDLSMFVDGYPVENSKCETQDLMENCGGPAANAAYLLAKWGCACAFAGLVGDDAYGQRVRAEFQSVGTDVSALELRLGHATPLSTILINQRNGSRTIVNRKRPAEVFTCDAPRFSPKLLYFDGHELAASLAAMQAHPNAVSILDAGSWREGTAALAERVHYLAASERFALQATGLPHLENESLRRECARLLREKFKTTVIVTMGERGLLYEDGLGARHLSAFPARTVDTTAAGDIFHGAFAYAILQRSSLEESLRFASMAAALSVESRGGRPSIPELARVRQALADSSGTASVASE